MGVGVRIGDEAVDGFVRWFGKWEGRGRKDPICACSASGIGISSVLVG